MATDQATKNYLKNITEAGEAKKQKLRSPSYTSIGLREAIEKVRVIWEHEKRNEVAVDIVAGHWKVAPKSSATLMAISTLKKFGLITDRGGGDQRYVKLTDLAYNILRAEPNTPTWIANVQKAALFPKIIAELWENDKENPKSTPSLKKYLEFEKHFNPVVIDEFIQSYRETISFAKLGIGDKVLTSESGGDAGETENGSQDDVLPPQPGERVAAITKQTGKKMLAQYLIPIGANEATITFTGAELTTGDFDALADYVGIFKREFERKQKAESSHPIPPPKPPKPAFPEPPFVALRKSATGETMVKIIGQPWFEKGEWIYQADGGGLVPAKELFPNLKK
jgi:hypothetical protein